MRYDRQIVISAAGDRRAARWPAQRMMLSEFYTRLSVPARGAETLEAYLRLPKAKQDDLKDVGGFVGGELEGGVRKNRAVRGRDLITLDFDNVPAGGTEDVRRRAAGLGCGYAIYSTRKHEPARPRLRLVAPLDRTATADEYEPIARKLAEMIGIEWCDPTTFQAVRMMYWPSVCADGEYVFACEDKPFLSADGMLALYGDWRDVAAWPQVPGQKAQRALAGRQEDPTAKAGVVGAFCRAYDVPEAMEHFLPGVYELAGEDRYTFTGGSTAGGAVVYDGGKFLYSHHATDPAGGRLVNSFDLVRLHLYGALDDEAKEGTPVAKLPSYTKMKQMAVADPAVARLLNEERYRQATEDFGAPNENGEGADWMMKLKRGANANPEKTIANVQLALSQAPALRGRFFRDEFSGRIYGVAPLPWGKHEHEEGEFPWTDTDDAGLRIYIEKLLGFRSREMVMDALSDYIARHGRNPVTDYLEALTWDGTPRLDTLFIDYLGARDTSYTRAVTRKAFVAAVARAFEPGAKFDYMVILSGRQGLGKSTLLYTMGGKWFTDSIRSFEGKDAYELVQGVLIAEIAELEAFSKSDISRIKQFLSQREDMFRAAYGRNVEWHKRRCVFFGTSNNDEYLRDRTGNRRFWPVDVGVTAASKSVFGDLPEERDQIWGEAVVRWRLGEPLHLSGELAKAAEQEQEGHAEKSPREGIVLDYMEMQVPEPWQTWDLQQRLLWLGGGVKYDGRMVERTKICAQEVWCEALKGELKYCRNGETAELNGIMRKAPGWKKTDIGIRFKYAGKVRGFVRTGTTAGTTDAKQAGTTE